MDIQQKDNGNEGLFYIELEGKIVGRMTYTWMGSDRIVINHTIVDDVLKGKGAGKQLVSKAVDFARAKGIKIVPVCSFAKSVFEKVEEFKDVL